MMTTYQLWCTWIIVLSLIHENSLWNNGKTEILLEYKYWSLWGLSSHKKKSQFKTGVASTGSPFSEPGLNFSRKAWKCKVCYENASILSLPNLTRKETDSDCIFYLRDYFEMYFPIFSLNTGPIWALYRVYKQERFWKLSLYFLVRQL